MGAAVWPWSCLFLWVSWRFGMTSKSMNLEYSKRSASQQGMLRKAVRLRLLKAEEKKITSFHVVCGLNNPLKLLVGDWVQANISHSLGILFICFLFKLCMHKQQREGFYKITGNERVGSNAWGKKKTEWEGWKEKEHGESPIYMSFFKMVYLSMKDQACKILLDIYNKERSKSPASNVSSLSSIMAKP